MEAGVLICSCWAGDVRVPGGIKAREVRSGQRARCRGGRGCTRSDGSKGKGSGGVEGEHGVEGQGEVQGGKEGRRMIVVGRDGASGAQGVEWKREKSKISGRLFCWADKRVKSEQALLTQPVKY
jgi:hypothetical protein